MRSQLATELSHHIDITGALGFHYVDLETDRAANDNGEYDDLFEDVLEDPRLYPHLDQTSLHVARALYRAGYSPMVIPDALRRTAFEVAHCFHQGLFDPELIAETLHFTRGQVRRATQALRRAARPGTRVG